MNSVFILKRPILSEKASKQMSSSIYHFLVARSVNKIQIKAELEKIYSVKVIRVNVVNVRAKKKETRTKRGVFVGSKSSFKKAIVKLQPGNFINFV